jgi:hypothetical protein
MIEQRVSFALPKPWNNELFSVERFGAVSFLVGPNGSGKSRFAESLKQNLPNARLLGTDRLQGMGLNQGFGLFGDNLAQGFQKNFFPQFKQAGINFGSGVDTFIILEERPDIRIIVEATLSNLFNRDINLEWDSGNLVPKALFGRTGDSYRIDRDECHGIRELLVLPTHLYNDQNQYLIIDEPELNLHPQFQSFLMQEVRKVAGQPIPGTRKKGVILITHSPFMIDLQSMDDLHSVFSFSSDHSVPRFIATLDEAVNRRLSSLIPRLNVHHKQLFFSDNPIFVEGILDAQLIEAIQERRQVSITAAGSCVIDVGGCEEVNKYLEFCRQFHKSAYFFYDLDSLFFGNLRQGIRADGTIAEFLAALGLGGDFGRYCGELDRKLTEAVQKVRESTERNENVVQLRSYIEGLADGGELRDKNLARARVAVLIDLRGRRQDIAHIVSEVLAADIEGRLAQIVEVLRAKNVLLLPGGALEHYLPSYQGDRYALSDAAKRAAVDTEVALLSSGALDCVLAERYGDLFAKVTALPAKAPVDTDSVLMRYLGDYVHGLQGLVIAHPDWGAERFNAHFSASSLGLGKLFSVSEFVRKNGNEFNATIAVVGPEVRIARVSHDTNAGMRRIELEPLRG